MKEFGALWLIGMVLLAVLASSWVEMSVAMGLWSLAMLCAAKLYKNGSL